MIVGGASIHIALGVGLLLRCARIAPAARLGAAAACVARVVVIAGLGLQLDPLRMASAVYRTRQRVAAARARVSSYLRDGKTATISVVRARRPRYHRAPTASPMPRSTSATAPRAPTKSRWSLAGGAAAEPAPEAAARRQHRLRLRPHHAHPARSTARVERLDSIEIEPCMVRGGRAGLLPRIPRLRGSAQPHHLRGREDLLRHHARALRHHRLRAVESLGERRGHACSRMSSTAASAAI